MSESMSEWHLMRHAAKSTAQRIADQAFALAREADRIAYGLRPSVDEAHPSRETARLRETFACVDEMADALNKLERLMAAWQKSLPTPEELTGSDPNGIYARRMPA